MPSRFSSFAFVATKTRPAIASRLGVKTIANGISVARSNICKHPRRHGEVLLIQVPVICVRCGVGALSEYSDVVSKRVLE